MVAARWLRRKGIRGDYGAGKRLRDVRQLESAGGAEQTCG
ncbi:hypothetical protein V6Z11_D05G358500 [Gossypium hirsutum]